MPTTAELDKVEEPRKSSFQQTRWSATGLLGGLALLAIWKLIPLAGSVARDAMPPWAWMVLAGILPQALMLAYPLWIRGSRREPEPAGNRQVRWLVEFSLAAPVVIFAVIAMLIINFLLVRWFPSAQLPDVFGNMEASQGRAMTIFMLVFAFTFAPIAEECFFRGFLYNAFGQRMPVAAAIILQSLIFGFSHSFGVTHAIGASLLGLLLTLVYEWRKTLVASIFVHSGINFTAALFSALLMLGHANSASLGVAGDPADTRCVLRTINPDSAAEEAGLQTGDVITAIDGEPIENFAGLKDFTRRHRAGDEVRITIERAGETMEVPVVLKRRG